jgi:hypothetical protein
MIRLTLRLRQQRATGRFINADFMQNDLNWIKTRPRVSCSLNAKPGCGWRYRLAIDRNSIATLKSDL